MYDLLQESMQETYRKNHDALRTDMEEASPKGNMAVSASIALFASKIAAVGTIEALEKAGFIQFDD